MSDTSEEEIFRAVQEMQAAVVMMEINDSDDGDNEEVVEKPSCKEALTAALTLGNYIADINNLFAHKLEALLVTFVHNSSTTRSQSIGPRPHFQSKYPPTEAFSPSSPPPPHFSVKLAMAERSLSPRSIGSRLLRRLQFRLVVYAVRVGRTVVWVSGIRHLYTEIVPNGRHQSANRSKSVSTAIQRVCESAETEDRDVTRSRGAGSRQLGDINRSEYWMRHTAHYCLRPVAAAWFLLRSVIQLPHPPVIAPSIISFYVQTQVSELATSWLEDRDNRFLLLQEPEDLELVRSCVRRFERSVPRWAKNRILDEQRNPCKSRSVFLLSTRDMSVCGLLLQVPRGAHLCGTLRKSRTATTSCFPVSSDDSDAFIVVCHSSFRPPTHRRPVQVKTDFIDSIRNSCSFVVPPARSMNVRRCFPGFMGVLGA
ncbi:hypothetical protein BDN71DRAFT_1501332 [Pleurotus eryngii]|uniref:Uncharacterized protein n=1 Tax=Pleurotus eryngii TaxID=5323 RepID=A0A9P6ABF6_PLEER|nr:hypothetical protein BDN71DRAFT_1501332 [Pleurotus eryngii]